MPMESSCVKRPVCGPGKLPRTAVRGTSRLVPRQVPALGSDLSVKSVAMPEWAKAEQAERWIISRWAPDRSSISTRWICMYNPDQATVAHCLCAYCPLLPVTVKQQEISSMCLLSQLSLLGD
jgi:hypothetical protein